MLTNSYIPCYKTGLNPKDLMFFDTFITAVSFRDLMLFPQIQIHVAAPILSIRMKCEFSLSFLQYNLYLPETE